MSLKDTGGTGNAPGDAAFSAARLHPVEEWADAVDIDAFCRHFLDEVSSLEEITMCVTSPYVNLDVKSVRLERIAGPGGTSYVASRVTAPMSDGNLDG